MVVSIVKEMYIYHYYQFCNIFITSKRNPTPLSHWPLIAHILQKKATTNLAIYIDLPILDTSYKCLEKCTQWV